jgi:hypothetical protein
MCNLNPFTDQERDEILPERLDGESNEIVR